MGFVHECNICKSSSELGEIETNNNYNNMKAKKKFESKIKKENKAALIKNNTIANIMTQYNKASTKFTNIELPAEIISTKPKNGFETELIKFDNGDTYQGCYNINNEKEGFGSYVKKNGFIFKGLWRDDQIGDYSLFIDPNGNYFKGNLIDGAANGEGELMIKEKFKYIGNFNNNIPNEKGKLFNFIDNSIYEGEIVNGKKEGKGTLQFCDGTIYEGEFFNDKYEGKGKMTFKNGCIYEGDFHDNMIDGKGKYIYPDGKEYNGDFQKGLKHGYGRLSWNIDKYFEGFWINNRQHGEGMFYLNGQILKGIFRYGKMIMKVE